MIAQSFQVTSVNTERPLQFSVLCVLTFLFGGYTLLFSIISLFTYPQAQELTGFLRAEVFPPYLANDGVAIISTIVFILAAISFAGIIGMWHRHKFGFWLFSISMILILTLPFVVFNVPVRWIITNLFPFFVIAVLLIVLLGYNLKNMR